ncbi:MAG: hypothetical protein WCD80_14825 [Desulfobaccales bacterium]
MSMRALKSILLLFLFASLAGLFLHVVKLPHDAAAKSQQAGLTFKGGSGDTPATAVIIAGAPDYVAVVDGEYLFLAKTFGKQNQAWQVVKKDVYQHDDRVYDVITIEFPHEVRQQVFFDITTYFHKPKS